MITLPYSLFVKKTLRSHDILGQKRISVRSKQKGFATTYFSQVENRLLDTVHARRSLDQLGGISRPRQYVNLCVYLVSSRMPAIIMLLSSTTACAFLLVSIGDFCNCREQTPAATTHRLARRAEPGDPFVLTIYCFVPSLRRCC